MEQEDAIKKEKNFSCTKRKKEVEEARKETQNIRFGAEAK
jgi:hypothetical protein